MLQPTPTPAPRNLTGLIIILTVLLISGLWIYSINAINNDYDRVVDTASRETMNLTIAFEEHVRRIISDADKDLLHLQDVYEQHGIDSPVFTFALKNIAKDPTRSTVLIIDNKGNIAANSKPGAPPINYADREYFRFHETSPDEGLLISRTIRGRQTDRQVIPLSRRINQPDGSFGGVIYIGLLKNSILEFYDKLDLGPQQWLSLSEKDGFHLALKSNLDSEFGSETRDDWFWKQAQSGILAASRLETPLDEVERVMSYRAMPDYPLTVAVGQSAEAVLSNYKQRKKDYILGTVLISLFIALYSGYLINKANKQRQLQEELAELVAQKTEELQLQTDRLSSLVNSMSDEVWFSDTRARYILVNETVTQNFGVKSADKIAMVDLFPTLEVYLPDGRKRPYAETPSLLALQGHPTTNHLTYAKMPATGEWRHRETNTTPVRDNNGTIIGAVSVVRDITDRIALENELVEHRDNLQSLVEKQVEKIADINNDLTSILESIGDPFYVLDKEWRFTYINKAALTQSNCSTGKMKPGKFIWEACPGLAGSQMYRKFHEAAAGEIPLHVLHQSLGSKKFYEFNLYPYSKGLLVYYRDITTQKKYEAEIARLDRLNMVGEMAASIGHEVRNPLTTVRGYLQWYCTKEAFAPYQQQFTLMIEELDRANAIITDFLSLAKNKHVRLVPTNLSAVIQSMGPLLQADGMRRGHTIDLNLGTVPPVMADASEIRQYILNLVANGADANPDGIITISTTAADDRVIVTVRDQGPGIAQEEIEKIWLPFYTTKEAGTGLGLPVCFQIAQRHHAAIEVDTSQAGTAFHLIFPITISKQ